MYGKKCEHISWICARKNSGRCQQNVKSNRYFVLHKFVVACDECFIAVLLTDYKLSCTRVVCKLLRTSSSFEFRVLLAQDWATLATFHSHDVFSKLYGQQWCEAMEITFRVSLVTLRCGTWLKEEGMYISHRHNRLQCPWKTISNLLSARTLWIVGCAYHH